MIIIFYSGNIYAHMKTILRMYSYKTSAFVIITLQRVLTCVTWVGCDRCLQDICVHTFCFVKHTNSFNWNHFSICVRIIVSVFVCEHIMTTETTRRMIIMTMTKSMNTYVHIRVTTYNNSTCMKTHSKHFFCF